MFWDDESPLPDPPADHAPISENSTRARLRLAQRMLFRTMLRLKAIQRESRDPLEVGRARAAYQEAEAELRSAWLDWRNQVRASMRAQATAQATTPSAAALPQDPPSEPIPLILTPRLRFARWLVERGVLTDWPDTTDSTTAPAAPGTNLPSAAPLLPKGAGSR